MLLNVPYPCEAVWQGSISPCELSRSWTAAGHPQQTARRLPCRQARSL